MYGQRFALLVGLDRLVLIIVAQGDHHLLVRAVVTVGGRRVGRIRHLLQNKTGLVWGKHTQLTRELVNLLSKARRTNSR